ncbi:hypothetical protein Btru_058397 [Bulinus truncatus]|nr:hypothetical protein Btru_058397 [Bulinus truncatus]
MKKFHISVTVPLGACCDWCIQWGSYVFGGELTFIDNWGSHGSGGAAWAVGARDMVAALVWLLLLWFHLLPEAETLFAEASSKNSSAYDPDKYIPIEGSESFRTYRDNQNKQEFRASGLIAALVSPKFVKAYNNFKTSKYPHIFVPVAIVCVFVGSIGNIGFFALFGNKLKRAYYTRDSLYFRFLATLDIMICLIVLPYAMFFEEMRVTNNYVCKGMEYVRHFLTYMAHLALLSYSFELPLRQGYTASRNHVKRASYGIFLLSALCSIPVVFLFKIDPSAHNNTLFSHTRLEIGCLADCCVTEELGTECLADCCVTEELGTGCLADCCVTEELGTGCLADGCVTEELGTECLAECCVIEELGTGCLANCCVTEELGTECLADSCVTEELGTECLADCCVTEELGTGCLADGCVTEELGTGCLADGCVTEELGTECLAECCVIEELGTGCLANCCVTEELGTECLADSCVTEELGTECLADCCVTEELGTGCLADGCVTEELGTGCLADGCVTGTGHWVSSRW